MFCFLFRPLFTSDMWWETFIMASQSFQTATPTKRSALLSRTRCRERAAPETSYSTTVKRSVESTLRASGWSRPTTTPTRCGPLAVTWWLWTSRPQVKLPTCLFCRVLLSAHQSNSLVCLCSSGEILHVFALISVICPAKDWGARGADKSKDQLD